MLDAFCVNITGNYPCFSRHESAEMQLSEGDGLRSDKKRRTVLLSAAFFKCYVTLFATIHVDAGFVVQFFLLGIAVGFTHGFILEDGSHVCDIGFDVALTTRFVARSGDGGQHEHCGN